MATLPAGASSSASAGASPPPLAARYVARFACIGPACEDTCCSGWSIPVDRDHYRRLKQVMGGSAAERERFRAACMHD